MKTYLVVELYKSGDAPRIIGLFKSKKDAERAAYDPRALAWRSVIMLRLI